MSYLALRHCNEEGHKYLYDMMKQELEKNQPLMIGKIGATELFIIVQTTMIANKVINDYNPSIVHDAIHIGIHPPTNNMFSLYSRVFLDKIKDINILASWNDNLLQFEENIWKQFINRHTVESQNEVKGIVDLMSLESFYTTPDKWWQNLYKDKTILIISPFVKSISKQLEYPQRDKVWSGKWNNFWDKSINFKYIKFPHPYATLSKEEQDKYPKTFLEVIRNFESEIDNIGDFDIALIAVGCYSIPLCSYVKTKKHHSAFHLGGGLQMMFGVYGNRWFQNGNPSQFFKEYINEHWIRPSGDEVPQGYKQQENGAYF